MIESLPAVATSAICGMSSMASLPRALPSAMPFESTRAATRWAGDMPSPMNRMTFFALRGPVSYTCQLSSRARLCDRDVAQDEGRLVLAVFALDEGRGLAEKLRMILAVHGHRDGCGID